MTSHSINIDFYKHINDLINQLKSPVADTRISAATKLGKLLKENARSQRSSSLIAYAIQKAINIDNSKTHPIDISELENIIEGLNDAAYQVNPDGTIGYISPVVEKITKTYTANELIGKNFLLFIHPDDRSLLQQEFYTMQIEKSDSTSEFRILEKDGNIKYVRASGNTIIRNGVSVGAVGILSDITENYQLQQQLAHDKELLDSIGDIAKVGGWEIDINNQNVIWTRQLFLIHEVDPNTFNPTVKSVSQFYDHRDRQIYSGISEKTFVDGKPFDAELRITTAKGNKKWIHATGYPKFKQGKIIGAYGSVQDITERKYLENKLKILSMHDALTGLHNRQFYKAYVNKFQGSDDPITVFFIDVDDMHILNNKHGHHTGDQAIKDLAVILSDVFPEAEVIARAGGDEFVVFIKKCDEKWTKNKLLLLNKKIDKYNLTKNPKIYISVGCKSDTNSHQLSDIIISADKYMFQNKQTKKIHKSRY